MVEINGSMARPTDRALAVPVEPASGLAPSDFDPSRVMPAIRALEAGCTAAVMSAIPDGHVCGVIYATKDQWEAQESAFSARERFFAAMMPTERDAIEIVHAAYIRLKGMDWNDPIYCPKDGSSFDLIEAGSTGIHKGHYSGEWPKGSWWVEGDDDLYPSRPILYRRTEAEKARWAKFAALAKAIDARSVETEGLDPKGESAVFEEDSPVNPKSTQGNNQ